MSRPYLSIVFTGRNDNHGGDFTPRMRLCLLEFVRLCNVYLVDSEIILVEWNPPAERPSLQDEIKDIFLESVVPVRIITIPESIHMVYKYSDRLPMFQMIAKNVGIRRANGEFILVTNLDIIPSEKLISFLGKKTLDSRVIYRSIRKDVDNIILNNFQNNLSLLYEDFVIRINDYYGSKNISTGEYNACYPKNIESISDKLGIFPVFSNACGDFQLMDNQSWCHLRGYPELEMFSLHIDSLFEYMAVASGVKEQILHDDMVVYHIEHGGGWCPESKDRTSIVDGLLTKKLRTLRYLECIMLNRWMKKNRKEFQFNSELWGHKGKDYKEAVISKSGVEEISLGGDGGIEKAVSEMRWLKFQLYWWQIYGREIVVRLYVKGRIKLLHVFPWVVKFKDLQYVTGKIVVFGAGVFGEDACKRIIDYGKKVDFFIDSDINKHEETLMNISVHPVKDILLIGAEIELIVIASFYWGVDMYKQIRKIGYRGKIAFVSTSHILG